MISFYLQFPHDGDYVSLCGAECAVLVVKD